MDSTPHKLLLRIPKQTRDNLSFAEPSEKGIARWIANLPKANIGETARQLYQGLIEINQYDMPAELRLAILERIRPEVNYVCTSLSKYYLGQAIVLEERPRKVANLSQSLQNHLANGYKIVVAQERTLKAREHGELFTLAIQRAMRSLCGPLLRAYQLYCPVAEGIWLELHQLYQLARHRKIHNLPVADPLSRNQAPLSIEHCYLSALLMGAAQPNQMRQSAMARLFSTLEAWCQLASLVPANESSSLLIVNPTVDSAPRYRSLLQNEDLSRSFGLDTHRLVEGIKRYMLNDAEASLIVPESLGVELLQHLSQSWGDLAERTFNRVPGRGTLKVSIGMSATHFRIAKRAFANFINIDEQQLNPFSDMAQRARHGAGWGSAFDGDRSVEWVSSDYQAIDYTPGASVLQRENSETEENEASYPIHELPIVNHSPGGFCLTWPKEVPKQLQAGELLSVQEAREQDWSLAVVRWIRQVRGGGTQMGVELIAPHCTPCAVKLVRKTGEPSHFLRALMLPAVSAIDRPATLITPRLPFQVNSKVIIHLGSHELRGHLTDRIAATGSFNQFEYRILEQPESGKAHSETHSTSLGTGNEDDFDSLWKSL
ncbi:molecular chaperone [Halopseudomonas phragmitis]|uniref:Molecular chaperone n=2 Tax=Pseudomonadaceae TaxID=135621 RepID=A0A1V0BA64_9GAMM|nr:MULTISPECIES: hypothetical protein [Pseudomonadaceae]AQZ96770.1 hypothetical protein BVH74_08820 [Halopseudomonas phragmitis]RHW23005.1 molecular chaperone [Pseudomonas jilinensis]